MVTIAHLAGKMIERKPFIEEALSNGIINYGALADSMLPDIEKELKKKVKHSAVMMALRRYAEKARHKLFKKTKFGEDAEIIMRSDLIEATVVKSPDSGDLIKKVYGFVDLRKGDFISVICGVHELSIITNKKHEKKLMECLKRKDVKNVSKGLSGLTVNIPEESTEIVGLFYMVTRALAWENISIIEIVSTWSEMTYIVKTEYAAFAFNAIKRLIEENV